MLGHIQVLILDKPKPSSKICFHSMAASSFTNIITKTQPILFEIGQTIRGQTKVGTFYSFLKGNIMVNPLLSYKIVPMKIGRGQ